MTTVFIGVVVSAGIVAALAFALSRVNKNLPKSTLTIRDHTFHAELAKTMLQKSQGLSGRDGLQPDTGMLFFFEPASTQGFWMKDMKFPIDIIWIREGNVVGFEQHVQPEPGRSMFRLTVYYSPAPVDRVLEVQAGTVAKYGIQTGDAVAVQEE